MKPVYQTVMKPPHGNCLQASVASILELELDQVPNFMLYGSSWDDKFRDFMLEFGLDTLTVPTEGAVDWNPRGYYFAVGKSPRGQYLHNVVCCNGIVVHDPFPGGNGELEEIKEYTLFMHTFEIPPKRITDLLEQSE